MSGWARTGVECVFVARAGGRWVADGEPMLVGPVRGRTYTVAGVMVDDEGVWIRLRGWGDDWFDARWFRPAIRQADDVALFARHLVGREVPA